jgi:putative addiction module component (TIGR02574 family)
MNTTIVAEALKYDVPDRILIVEEIWDSIAQEPEAIPITEVQKKELARRLQSSLTNPESGTSWDVVRERIVGR